MTRDEALPQTKRGSLDLLLDRIGFGFFHGLEIALQGLFLTAIVLGVARILLLGTLALIHRAIIEGRTPPLVNPPDGPKVSVLIPCFNEQKVIVASVNRILASRWANLEVIVPDDGSKDHTSRVVSEAFSAGPSAPWNAYESIDRPCFPSNVLCLVS